MRDAAPQVQSLLEGMSDAKLIVMQENLEDDVSIYKVWW